MKNTKLIKASAGSGKTYTLMGLLSDSISEGVRPEGLLATTFTVAAAAELQSRIRQKLLGGPQPELASQVFDGLIGTVNGVCGQLLSEYAIESGLSPALDVLPDDNTDLIFAAATHSVLEQHADELGLESLAAKFELNPQKEKYFGETADWRKDVRKIVKFARSNAINEEGLKKCAEKSCAALKEIFTASIDLSLENIADTVHPLQDFDAQGGDTKTSVKAVKDFVRFPTWSKAAGFGSCQYNKTKDPEFPIHVLNEIGEHVLHSKEFFADFSALIRGVFSCAADALAVYAQYKKNLGLVDFVDQESNVLELLEKNANFCDLMSRRINQIMVDEFQDTSPIQLALFLKLNACSQKGSVWVGDPKQAIYGFRGTDPELMENVAAAIPDYSTLKYSWRSKENLVKLSNAIFKRAFSQMLESDVVLEVPEERREKAAGGKIEAWHLCGRNAGSCTAALAEGIAGLIREKNVVPQDICVLFRTNVQCSALADALAKWNISASAPAGNLLEHTECQLVMAAYRYCINNADTAALAALLALYGEDPDWLNKLCRGRSKQLSLPQDEQKTIDPFADAKEAEWLKKLIKPDDATPLEILEYVITALGLDRKIASMSNPDLRLSNLDELRNVCNKYMEQALVNRTAATPEGFVTMIYDSNDESAAGFGRNTVNVMTYHQSKGLEFPIVIMGSLNSSKEKNIFDILIRQAENFDVNDPLKDRMIHYWPWPFGGKKKIAGLEDTLRENVLQQHIKKRENEERKRLLYVGLTRAKDHLIFAMERKSPTQKELKSNPNAVDTLQISWLDDLTDYSMFSFPMESGEGELVIGEDRFALNTSILTESDEITPLSAPVLYGDETNACDFAPARKNPSKEEASGAAVLLTEWEYFTGKIKCESGKFNLLGDAFHDYLALNPKENGRFYAQRLLENYGIANAVAPEVMVECCQNLYNWISSAYPDAKISCELPVTYHDENGTLYQGFIDMLLDLSEGFVIVDHKTHPTLHDAEKYASNCAGQLRLYRKAVEAATGRKVLQTIIHLPNLGRCFEVR